MDQERAKKLCDEFRQHLEGEGLGFNVTAYFQATQEQVGWRDWNGGLRSEMLAVWLSWRAAQIADLSP